MTAKSQSGENPQRKKEKTKKATCIKQGINKEKFYEKLNCFMQEKSERVKQLKDGYRKTDIKNRKSDYSLMCELSVIDTKVKRLLYFWKQKNRNRTFYIEACFKNGLEVGKMISNFSNISVNAERYFISSKLWTDLNFRTVKGKKELSMGKLLRTLKEIQKNPIDRKHPSTNFLYWLGFNTKTINELKKQKEIGSYKITHKNEIARRNFEPTFNGLKIGTEYIRDFREHFKTGFNHISRAKMFDKKNGNYRVSDSNRLDELRAYGYGGEYTPNYTEVI